MFKCTFSAAGLLDFVLGGVAFLQKVGWSIAAIDSLPPDRFLHSGSTAKPDFLMVRSMKLPLRDFLSTQRF
jgi:hypothetical protein